MESLSDALRKVLNKIESYLIGVANGPAHVIVVIEMDRVSAEKVSIKYYLSPKEHVLARTDGIAIVGGEGNRGEEEGRDKLTSERSGHL